jgi:hypothetical protein
MKPAQETNPELGTAAAAVKYISKKIEKVACFSTAKNTTQPPTLHHAITTTSPRLITTKTGQNRKTPCKNHLDTPPNFFPRPNPK